VFQKAANFKEQQGICNSHGVPEDICVPAFPHHVWNSEMLLRLMYSYFPAAILFKRLS